MRWQPWLHTHPRTNSHHTPAAADSRCDTIPTGVAAGREGYVRLHADCGRAEFDADHQLIRVACPAVWCGAVSVADNVIQAHPTRDNRERAWGGWRIVDDKVAAEKALS
ncbi:hypothetical protein [Nocardia brasiliensis]|uniref:hypothetical protein n=1 Tax=Nocardia brasiliensis TaxID=37326 RepID=UPI00366FA643